MRQRHRLQQRPRLLAPRRRARLLGLANGEIKLLRGGDRRAVERRAYLHPEPRPLGVVLQQLADDAQRRAELGLAEVMQHDLQGVERVAGGLAHVGAEADVLHPAISGAAEHQCVGRVVHVAIVVDPIRGDFEVPENQRRRGNAHQ
jgi:hypothetical protein